MFRNIPGRKKFPFPNFFSNKKSTITSNNSKSFSTDNESADEAKNSNSIKRPFLIGLFSVGAVTAAVNRYTRKAETSQPYEERKFKTIKRGFVRPH